MLHCCFSIADSSPILLPSLFSSTEQCCVQLFGVAVTNLHQLILFMFCCPLPLIYFPLLFHYELNPESPQPLYTPGVSFTSCTDINKLPQSLNPATSLPFLPLPFCHLPSLRWEGSKFCLLPCPQFQVSLACFSSFLKLFSSPTFSSFFVRALCFLPQERNKK